MQAHGHEESFSLLAPPSLLALWPQLLMTQVLSSNRFNTQRILEQNAELKLKNTILPGSAVAKRSAFKKPLVKCERPRLGMGLAAKPVFKKTQRKVFVKLEIDNEIVLEDERPSRPDSIELPSSSLGLSFSEAPGVLKEIDGKCKVAEWIEKWLGTQLIPVEYDLPFLTRQLGVCFRFSWQGLGPGVCPWGTVARLGPVPQATPHLCTSP